MNRFLPWVSKSTLSRAQGAGLLAIGALAVIKGVRACRPVQGDNVSWRALPDVSDNSLPQLVKIQRPAPFAILARSPSRHDTGKHRRNRYRCVYI